MTIFAICTGVMLIVCSALNWIYSEKVISKHESFGKVCCFYGLIVIVAAVTCGFFSTNFQLPWESVPC